MLRFLRNITIFIIPLLILFYYDSVYLLIDQKYKDQVYRKYVYVAIQRSKQKTKSKKLLLGDSVARQMFPDTLKIDTIYSLASNIGVSLAGQYILLQNHLEAGNKPETVYLVLSPYSFMNNLNQKFTYNYFLKPFLTRENKKHFTPTVQEQIEKIGYKYLLYEPHVRTSDWSPPMALKDSLPYNIFSPISIEYVAKIKQLTEENNIKLFVLPVPMSNGDKVKILSLIDQDEIAQTGMINEFNEYFNKIPFLNDTCFYDGAHFYHPELFTDWYANNFLQ